MKHFGIQMAGQLDLAGQQIRNLLLSDDSDEVTFPVPGRVARIGGRLLMCVDYTVPGNDQTAPIWVPLLQERNIAFHDQTEASATWNITHNMNSARVMIQIFDSNNNVIMADSIENNTNNTSVVTLSTPATGYAIIISGNIDGTPKPNVVFDQEVTAQTSVVVSHNLGYNPVIRFISDDGFEVLPTIQHTSTNSATLTFTSAVTGTVYCY